jgi:rare lipoprotein A
MIAYFLNYIFSYAHRLLSIGLLLGLFFNLQSCNAEPEATPAPAPEPQVKETKIGLASFYSKSFEGEETASGETFTNAELVAAHPTYPLGTLARVTNLENNSTVEVRINDRGPTRVNRKKGVIIDLSQSAAKKLGMMKDGKVQVRVEVLEWGSDERQP